MDCFFFFFKQKTAYEIVSRDWSSDVCSSDLKLVPCCRIDPVAVCSSKFNPHMIGSTVIPVLGEPSHNTSHTGLSCWHFNIILVKILVFIRSSFIPYQWGLGYYRKCLKMVPERTAPNAKVLVPISAQPCSDSWHLS